MSGKYKLGFITLLILLFSTINMQLIACDVTITKSNATICAGDTLHFNCITVTGSPATYSWLPTTGLSAANIANPIASPTATTTYIVTATCSGGGTAKDTIIITVNPKPVADFTFTPNNVCANSLITFTNTSTGAGLTYSWNFGDGNFSTSTNPSHAFTAMGGGIQNFGVLITTTNSFGCKDTTVHLVKVIKTPDATLIDNAFNNFSNCSSGTTSFTLGVDNASTTMSFNATYDIDWGDGSTHFNSATFNATQNHTYSTQGFFTLVYTITGSNGCIDTSHYIVFNGGNPSVGLSNPGNTIGCGATTFTFPVTNTSGNPPGTTYTVNFSDGSPSQYFTSPPTSVTHTFNISSCGYNTSNFTNAFKITIIAQNPCGTSAATVEPIYISSPPTAAISSPSSECINTNVYFTNVSNSGCYISGGTSNSQTKSNWKITPATGWYVASGTLGNNNPTFNPSSWGSINLGVVFTQVGTYQVMLNTGNNCSNDTAYQTICIAPPPTPSFTLNKTTGCSNLLVKATNTSTSLTACYTTYHWNIYYSNSNCGNLFGNYSFTNGTSISTKDSAWINFTVPGTYSISLSITNPCGTFTTPSQTVVVKTAPSIYFNSIPPACSGSTTINPSNYLVASNCASNALTYAWTFANGTPATSSSSNIGNVTFANQGAHNITVAVTNECGTSNANVNYQVYPTLNVNAGSNVPICIGNGTTLSGSASGGSGGSYSYQWSPSGSLWSPYSSSTYATPSSTTTYTLSVTDGNNCTSSNNVVVTVNNLPNVTVGSPTKCANQATTLTAGGASTYTWNPSTYLNTTTGSSVICSATSNITYSITGVSAAGCPNTTYSAVYVNPVTYPNAGSNITLCNQPIASTLVGYSPSGGVWSGSNVTSAGIFTPNGTGNFKLFYAYTNGFNCIGTDSIIVSVVNPQVANAGTGFKICNNGAIVNLSGATPVGGNWSGNGVAANVFTPINAPSGINILTYTFGNGTCLSTDTIKVNVIQLPTVTVNSAFLCNGDTAHLNSGTANTYSWTPSAGLSSTNTASVIANPTVTTTYIVTGTNTLTGCSDTAQSVVTVQDLPIIQNTVLNQNVCSGTPSNLVSFSSLPSGATFNWNSLTSGVITGHTGTGTGDLPSMNLLNTTNHSDSIIYNVKPILNGCVGDSIYFHYIVKPLPIISLPANDTICSGAKAKVVHFISNLNNTTYSYSAIASNASVSGYLPNGILDSIPSQIIFNSSVNPEQITYTITPTTDGCIGVPVVYTIVINPSPAVNFSIPNQTICSGNSSSLVNISSPSSGSNITWQCSIPTGITGSGLLTSGASSIPSQILNDTLTTPVTLNFIVTASTSGNTLCAGAANTYSITVNPIPLAFSSPLKDTICSGTATNFSLTSNVTGSTFNWVGIAPVSVSGASSNTGNLISDNLTNTSVLEQIAGYTITPIYTNNSVSCSGLPIIANAWVNPSPIVSFSMADQNVCNFQNSQTVQLSSLTPNVSFNWSSNPNGVFGVTPNGTDSIGIQSLQKSGFTSTAITYSATATYRGCVGLPSIYTINLRPLPFVNFNVNYLNCKGALVQFTNNSSGVQNHYWSFGDTSSVNHFSSPTHIFNSTDTFVVNYIAESQYGCQDSLKDTLVVVDIPVTNFVLGNDSGCAPLNVSILNNTTGYNPTYTWSFNNGNTSNINSQSPPNQFYNSAVSKNDTIYQISLTASNICGSSTHIDTIKVIDIPKPFFGLNSHNACSPFSCQFLNVSTGSIQTYTWIFGDGTTSNVKNPAPHLYYANGADSVYHIQLIVSNSCGSDTLKDSIIIHPKNVAAFATATPNVGCTPLTVNFSAIAQGATGWHWDFGNGNSSSFINGTQVYTTGTYTAYFYSDNGCSYDTQAVVITVNPLPFLTSSVLPPNACINQNLTFTNTSAGLNYSLWNLGDGTTTLNNSITHSYTASGVYHAFLVGTSQTTGCTDTLFRSITVNPLPVVAINPVQDTICLYATAISLSGLPNGGTFSGVGVSGSVGSFTFNPAVSSAGALNYINYSYTNANGCTGTTKDSIFVINPTPINFTGLPASLCTNNSSVSLTGIPSGGIFSGIGVVGNTFNPSISGAGTHTVTYTYTNANNCTNTVTHSVIVNALPTLNISSTPNNICINATSLNLSATPSGGIFYGSGIVSNTFNPSTVGVGGAYQFYYAYTDANGCSDTAAASINVLGLPGVNINPLVDTVCVNSIAVSLSGNPSGGVFNGVGVSGSVGNFTFNPSTPGAGGPYLITYTYTNASGCSNATTDSISVINPTPVNIINLPSTICINAAAITLQGTPVGGTFSGSGVSGGKFNPALAGVGTHTILYSYTDNKNCTNTNTATIQVNNTASLSIQAIPSSVCFESNPITLSASPSGGYFNGNGVASNQFNPKTAGVGGPYNIYYVYANGNGCVDSSSVTIIVRPNAIANVQLSPLSGCIPLPVSTVNNTLNATIHKWYWDDGDSSLLPNPTHIYQYTNFYQVIYIADNTYGCSDTALFNVTTYSKPTSNFNLVNLYGCNTPYSLTPLNISSGNNINQWSWDSNTSNLIQPNITFTDTGKHTIELIVTNNLGCKDTFSQNFQLYPLPVAGFTIQPQNGCEPLLTRFINNSIHARYYNWLVGGAHYSNDKDTICWFNTTGTYAIQLDVMNYNKTCSSSYVMPNNLIVFDKPKADFQFLNINSAPPNIEVQFTNTSSSNTISYTWNFGDGETDTAANPTHLYSYLNDFKTTLISFTADGCSDTITKTIETKFNHGLFVPDAFMPFSDKEKSVKYFLPVGLGLRDYHLSIYNTHGTLLFESTALDEEGRPTEHWDGTFKGEELQQDVYVWKIEATFNDGSIWQGNTYDGKSPKRIGNITLLK